ncbi:MAG: molybdenum cofactor guanylyltransferase, partial [Ignavibacteria bacterium]
IYKWKGPLAGIHSALVHSATEKLFVLSCDVPLMSREMIEYIVNYKSEKPIVFCEANGYHQPLVGIYSKSILGEIEKFIIEIENGDKSFHHFLKNADAEIIHPEKLSFYKDELFFNVNKPEDFERLKIYFIHNY